jgi:precorrin-2/cobalt-factor-2 C20-methyltransferase
MPVDDVIQKEMIKIGRLYGVGVGPGDPELLTLKAQRVLAHVPVVFIPQKSEENGSIAESIIIDQVPHVASKCIGIVLPMLRDRKKLQQYWQQAADIIWDQLSQGKDGAFVNVGDPLFYSTFIYIMEALRSRHPEIEIEVIPGVSSMNAAAARADVPLASDDDNIAVISGEQKDEIIKNALENFDTVVFMKVNTVFERLLVILEEMNLSGRSIYVRRCTTEDEEIIRDISRLKGKKLDYFSLLRK